MEQKPRRSFIQRTVYEPMAEQKEAGKNISWAAILAGLVTFLATSLLLSLIGTAIGFGGVNFTDAHPMSGVTMGVTIWSVVSILLSLGLGGFVAGVTAGRAGLIHGFLTWALSIIASFMLATSAISGAFGLIGNVASSVGNVAGDVATSAGQAASNMSQQAFDSIAKNVDVNYDELDAQTRQILADTHIPELQPEYLQEQIDATIADVQAAGKQVVVDGQDPKVAIDAVVNNIQQRAETVAANVDETALRNAIAENTDLTTEEADDAVNNIMQAYDTANQKTQEYLAQAQDKLIELEAQAEQVVEEARVKAQEVSNDIAKYSAILFVGLVLAATLSSYAGYAGSSAVHHRLSAMNE
ncbi:hypothetical protein CJ205_06630 [Dolosicoccus paucivorans]|uniref:PhnA-like protein n=1 Tax=Dolosicoccus paucivorans TaxID=84521 RepID=A0A2N6SLS1_9LACT|nr:hypothetical protein [Dolosicoccus paucivorans]PMB84383.1 hypothetical protein CJ206_04395 [Dolosicoccus paucivorans]PMC58003.1 hypothetical protein CJ205_06630 [Dolosicoccus paucivorans]